MTQKKEGLGSAVAAPAKDDTSFSQGSQKDFADAPEQPPAQPTRPSFADDMAQSTTYTNRKDNSSFQSSSSYSAPSRRYDDEFEGGRGRSRGRGFRGGKRGRGRGGRGDSGGGPTGPSPSVGGPGLGRGRGRGRGRGKDVNLPAWMTQQQKD